MWRRMGLIFLGLWSVSTSAVTAQTISGITLTLGVSDTHVRIEGQGAKEGAPLPKPKIFMIDGQQPRIVADFAKASASLTGRQGAGGQTLLDGAGHITGIRFAPRGSSGLRFVFDLSPEAKLDTLLSSAVASQIVLQVKGRALPLSALPIKALPLNKETAQPASLKTRSRIRAKDCKTIPCPRLAPHYKASAKLARSAAQKEAVSSTANVNLPDPQSTLAAVKVIKPRYFGIKTPFPRLKTKSTIKFAKPFRRPVIVIDPGHGGRDPGAIGTRKTREKDITFKASLELQKSLLKSGRYKVILTRTDDTYIEHAERLRIARAGGADLFISVHADSTTGKTARGASVYTLADRAKKRSKKIVSTQNWIMDVDLGQQSNSVGDILVDLAQRKTATQSDAFAAILLDELEGATHLVGNSHRKAGYFVLLAPDVPAVLLELGFLSNPGDEKLLKNKSHRAKIVKSVTRAIDKYFKQAAP